MIRSIIPYIMGLIGLGLFVSGFWFDGSHVLGAAGIGVVVILIAALMVK